MEEDIKYLLEHISKLEELKEILSISLKNISNIREEVDKILKKIEMFEFEEKTELIKNLKSAENIIIKNKNLFEIISLNKKSTKKSSAKAKKNKEKLNKDSVKKFLDEIRNISKIEMESKLNSISVPELDLIGEYLKITLSGNKSEKIQDIISKLTLENEHKILRFG